MKLLGSIKQARQTLKDAQKDIDDGRRKGQKQDQPKTKKS